MQRDDLRVGVPSSCCEGSHFDFRPVTDADLASLGYVRLDGMDVEALRSALSEFDGPWGAQEWATRRVATAMRQVLAALDGAQE